jgi:hypothetical protein
MFHAFDDVQPGFQPPDVLPQELDATADDFARHDSHLQKPQEVGREAESDFRAASALSSRTVQRLLGKVRGRFF